MSVTGPESTDEMAELTLQVLTRNASDHATLIENVWLKLREDDIEVLQALLARDPNDHVSHTSLGARYFEKGDVERAFQHFEKAVELDPTFASAEHNLATALMNRRPTTGSIGTLSPCHRVKTGLRTGSQ